ncbi:MAG: prepilin-type N-terminal cleavage/methylation domain-containing protein [Candidatus Uhrbacteria bacterium]
MRHIWQQFRGMVIEIVRSACGGQRLAFTLIEMLVAIGIFAIVVGITSDLFLIASRQEQRTRVLSRLEGDARIVMETIAGELREGFVDPGISEADLAIRQLNGDVVAFRRVTSGCPNDSAACLEILRKAGDNPWEQASLTGSGVTVEAFDVVQSDSLQPFATVYVALSAEGGRKGTTVTTAAQTTIVSRVYVQ